MGRHVTLFRHIILIPSQLILLFNIVYLEEKQQMPVLYFLFWPNWGSNPRPTDLKIGMITITPPIQFACSWQVLYFLTDEH